MRLLVLARTVAIVFLGLSACVPSAKARQDKEPSTISRDLLSRVNTTNIIVARALNSSAARDKKHLFVDDKDNEARGLTQFIRQMIGWTVPVEVAETPLRGIMDVKKWRKEAAAIGVLSDFLIAEEVLKKRDWRDSICGLLLEAPPIRKLVFHQCLESDESPRRMFRYMKLHGLCTPADKDSVSPKLLAWFVYIQEFWRPSGASTSGMATSSGITRDRTTGNTADTIESFGEKELVEFLELEINLQRYQEDMSSAVSLSRVTPLSSRKQVVTLIEWLRHNPHMKSFAEHMQFWLVSESDTEKLVFDAWRQTNELPETLFGIMRFQKKPISISENNPKFIAWLTYLASFWKNMPFNDLFFKDYDNFLSLLSSSGIPYKLGRDLITSNAFHNALNEVPLHGIMPHAFCLKRLWQIRPWLDAGETPEIVFARLGLTSRIPITNVEIVIGTMFILLYRKQHDFTSEQLFDLLSPANIGQVERLYEPIHEVPILRDVANDVLAYIRDRSTNMLDLPPISVQPENLFQYLVGGGENQFRDILKRFRQVVAHFRLFNDMKTEDAIKEVIQRMKIIMNDHDWTAALEELKKDSRVTASLIWREISGKRPRGDDPLAEQQRKRSRGFAANVP